MILIFTKNDGDFNSTNNYELLPTNKYSSKSMIFPSNMFLKNPIVKGFMKFK